MQIPSNITYGRGYVYCLQYHVVWATKYRKPILLNTIETDLKDLLMQYATEQGLSICAIEIMRKRLNIWYLAFCSSGSYNGSR